MDGLTEKEIRKRELEEIKLIKKNPKLLDTLLSKERTLLSRQRTVISIAQLALGIAALGLVIIRFFVDVEHFWFIALGWGMVIVAAYLFYHSFIEYRHFQKKLAHLHMGRGHLDKLYIEA